MSVDNTWHVHAFGSLAERADVHNTADMISFVLGQEVRTAGAIRW